MHDTAHATQIATQPPQLNLPSGPVALLRGGRSTKTDEDRDFLAAAFKVKAGGVGATAVYRCLAYYASLTNRRIAYPSQSTISTYCDMSDRQVRRILPKLEADGWITCLIRKRGACSSTYKIATIGHNVRFEPDIMSYEEGKAEERSKDLLSLDDDVEIKGEEETKPQDEIRQMAFPSQETAKALIPETTFKHPKVVRLLFKLLRKLGYRADNAQAVRFDSLGHEGQMRVLDPLLLQEQKLALAGLVPPPPVKKMLPHIAIDRAPREKPTCREHVWAAPDEDHIVVCCVCFAEREGA